MQRSERIPPALDPLIHSSFPSDYVYFLVIMYTSPIVKFTFVFVPFNIFYVGMINTVLNYVFILKMNSYDFQPK